MTHIVDMAIRNMFAWNYRSTFYDFKSFDTCCLKFKKTHYYIPPLYLKPFNMSIILAKLQLTLVYSHTNKKK